MRPWVATESVVAALVRQGFDRKALESAVYGGDPLLATVPDTPQWELDKPGLWRAYVERGSRRLRIRVSRTDGGWLWTVERVNSRGHVYQMASGWCRTRSLAKRTGHQVAKLYATGVASW